MESIDSRLKRIEQRISSIEKFIAENITRTRSDLNAKIAQASAASHSTPPTNQAAAATTTATSDTVAPEPTTAPAHKSVNGDYHYDYSAEVERSKSVKATFHQVDSNVFNAVRQAHTTDETVNMGVGGTLIVLVLALLGRLLIDLRWMGAVGQISFGAALSFIFIGAGYLLRDSAKYYIRYLPIIGLILLNITVYGASNYYQLMPKNIGLLFTLLISSIGLFLYHELKLMIFQILAVIGAYVMPLYISSDSGLMFINFYYLIASIFFMVVAVRYQFIPTAILSAYLSIAICGLMEYVDNDVMNKVLFTLGHFVIFAGGYVLYVVRSKNIVSKVYTFAFFPLIVFFYAIEYNYLQEVSINWVPLFALLVCGILFGLSAAVKLYATNDKMQVVSNLLISSAFVIAAHSVYFVLMPAKLRTIAMVLSSFAVFKYLDELLKDAQLLKKMISYVMFALMAWVYFEVMVSQFGSRSHLPIVNGFIFTLVLGYVAVFEKVLGAVPVNSLIVASLGHLIALVSLFNILKNKSTEVLAGSLLAYVVFAGVSSFLLMKQNQPPLNPVVMDAPNKDEQAEEALKTKS